MSLVPQVGTEARSDAAPLISVLQLLVDSGFVRAAELGNLAQVCSDMNRATLEDSIWASLCQREYPGTRYFSRRLLDVRGYRWIYKCWSAPTFKRRRPLPPHEEPPSLSAKQISFCIHIRYDGNLVHSDIITGEELSFLFENGSVGYTFSDPFVVGKAEWDYTEREKLEYETQGNSADRGLPVKCDGFDVSKVDATIHMLRDSSACSEASMIRVFDSNDFGRPLVHESPLVHPSLEHGETLTPETKFGTTKFEDLGLLTFEIPADTKFRAWPLRPSNVAELIQERIEHPLFFYLNIRLGTIEDGHFAIVGLVCTVLQDVQELEGGDPYPLFNSLEEKEKHGVTLLHILSELQDNM